jgi:hypothetical protein
MYNDVGTYYEYRYLISLGIALSRVSTEHLPKYLFTSLERGIHILDGREIFF